MTHRLANTHKVFKLKIKIILSNFFLKTFGTQSKIHFKFNNSFVSVYYTRISQNVALC